MQRTPIVTTAPMRALEQATVDAGATWGGLMEQAGWGVAQVALRLLGGGRDRRVLVLVGPGNNGGDGLVVARHLHDAGAHVALYLWRRTHPETDGNWQHCRRRGIVEQDAAADPQQTWLRSQVDQADLVVDALLGMGTTRPVTGTLAQIVEVVNATGRHGDMGAEGQGGRGAGGQARAHCMRPPDPLPAGGPVSERSERPYPPVLSIDLPTGINSDTGAVLGVAIRADLTVATGLIKRGLLLHPGRGYAGALAIADIGIPPTNLEAIMSELLTDERARALLPARPAEAHKGTFGKVMVVAGSLHYPGAAALACAGAARVGAGLVTLAAGRTVLGMGGRGPEVTLLPLPEGEWGAVGPNAVEELGKHMAGYAALLIGPGLGQADPTKQFIQRMLGLEQPKSRGRVGFLSGGDQPATEGGKPLDLPPTVLDADGLNLLAAIEDWPEHLPKGRLIFTPHPGEMRRLLKVDELPDDLVDTTADAAQRWGQVLVLKGATTIIAGPDGRTLVHDGANPALATAGTGDVLAGAIAGLLAQGLAPFDAAALGVYLHAAAGARVRESLGDSGALASDLLLELPRAIKHLRS